MARTLARALLCSCLLGACGGEPASSEEAAPTSGTEPGAPERADAGAAPAPALLPEESPSLAQLPAKGLYLADVASCGHCHPDAFRQQQSSGHAFASFNNPIYRASVEALRSSAGREASQMCAGCHDAALQADGAMLAEVEAEDERAHNGVSCRLCHGIKSAGSAGNGSYVVSADDIALPVQGDSTSLQRHIEAVRPLDSSLLCGSCHQSFLSTASGNRDFLGGQNELRSWADSAYAGQGAGRVDSVEAKSCVQCHMPLTPALEEDAAADAEGRIASHEFLGGHTWLAAMRGDNERLARTQAFLQDVIGLDALAVPGTENRVVDVIIRNAGVGHRFPGGVRDAAQTWLEVELLGEGGRLLARSDSAEPHRLQALLADADGALLEGRETHEFAALIADHSIAPRDVAVIRYRAPDSIEAGSISAVRVRLRHQSRSSRVHALACAGSRSPEGRAFASAARALGHDELEACATMPITELASAERSLATPADFRRSYEHGLGLLHAVQERVSQARPSLLAALELASNDSERAMALTALGQLEARLGRVEEAEKQLGLARRLAPRAAAIPAALGDASARVWRWREASEHYRQALALAGENSGLWRRFAVALGSAGEQGEALEAAQRGLALAPRDADLLRVQALALKAMGAADAEEALAAYLRHRGPDHLSEIRLRCVQRSARCAREALLVHEHPLLAVP